jgi:hypothetical protein
MPAEQSLRSVNQVDRHTQAAETRNLRTAAVELYLWMKYRPVLGSLRTA